MPVNSLVNALLIRWAKGYRWVTDSASITAHGRREAYLALGAVQSEEEADRVGTAVLATRKDPIVTTTAGLEPTGTGDVPYANFDLGDSINVPDEGGSLVSRRLRALTVHEDDTARAVFTGELGTLVKERDEAVQVWLRRMANGALGGTSESAQPALPPPPNIAQRNRPRQLPPFSMAGALDVAVSPRYYVAQDVRVIEVEATLGTAGSSNTVVDIYRSGVNVHTVTLGSGVNRLAENVSITYSGPAGQWVNVGVSTVGTGAKDLTVTLRIA